MNLKSTRIFLISVLLAAMMIFPVAGVETNVSNETMNTTTPLLTEIPVTTALTSVNESVNVTESPYAYNCTEFTGDPNCTMNDNVTEPAKVRLAALTNVEPMVYTTLARGDIPPQAQNYDHYVSFRMRANSFAPNYAYDLVARGEPSDTTLWVYNMYMFGKESGWDGRLAVYDNARHQLSPVSVPLSTGTDYTIEWQYNNVGGGELFVNGASQGPATGGGILNTGASSSFHVGENMYTGDGRQHSAFDGQIWDVYHYEKDLDRPVVYTYSVTNTDGEFNSSTGQWKWNEHARNDIQSMIEYFNNTNNWEKNVQWKQKFYEEWPHVTTGNFGVNPLAGEHTLNEATLHYHTGHGSSNGDGTVSMLHVLDDGPPPVDIDLTPPEVKGKWGGNNKWVILSSCYVLRDNRWEEAIATSHGTHGILGYKTQSTPRKIFMKTFFEFAKLYSVRDSYLLTVKRLDADTMMQSPDGKWEHLTAAAIFSNENQAVYDYLPGNKSGIQPDADPVDPVWDQWPKKIDGGV
jgi:hypothetical protein